MRSVPCVIRHDLARHAVCTVAESVDQTGLMTLSADDHRDLERIRSVALRFPDAEEDELRWARTRASCPRLTTATGGG
jgi:hypothetical protein